MPAVSAVVAVEFVAGSGTYVDLSTRVTEVRIIHPRTAPSTATQPTTFEISFLNHPATAAEVATWGAGVVGACPLSPDSPLAAFWPNVVSNRRFKITYTWAGGASTSVRGQGWVDEWTPDAGSSPPSTAVVNMTGSCILSQYAKRRVLSFFGEESLRGTDCDYWPYDDGPDATLLRGRGSAGNPDPAPAELILPGVNNTGSATLSEPDGGHITDGQWEFTRGDPTGPSPVVLHTLRGATVGSIQFWVKLSTDPAGLTDDIMVGYDASGNRLWRFVASISGGIIIYQVQNDAGVMETQYNSGAGRDDGWRFFVIGIGPANIVLFTGKKGESSVLGFGSTGSMTVDPSQMKYLTVGGNMPPFRKTKQTNTLQGGVSSISLQYSTGLSLYPLTIPAVRLSANDQITRIIQYGIPFDTLVGGSSNGSLTDTTPVMLTANVNKTLLDMWNEHTITVGGRLSTLPSGLRSWRQASETRPITVALTLDAEQDLHAPAGGWSSIKTDRPTRITVNSPVGTVTEIDAAAEALTGLASEGPSISSAAGSTAVARSVAGRVLSATAVRLSSFGLDATSTSTDKLTAIMALVPGDRVQISNLPSSLVGFTSTDVYASGWQEIYNANEQSVYLIFDSDPADDPVEAVFDSSDSSRWGMGDDATVTGGTCLGTTATGTVIVTTSAGNELTTTGGDYPMQLNWSGETITVSGVGGGTSPQTVTVTARGVSPSVARSHVAGDSIDVFHAFTWSP
jgi:hypothetical protein